jgi:hypothetical protein
LIASSVILHTLEQDVKEVMTHGHDEIGTFLRTKILACPEEHQAALIDGVVFAALEHDEKNALILQTVVKMISKNKKLL